MSKRFRLTLLGMTAAIAGLLVVVHPLAIAAALSAAMSAGFAAFQWRHRRMKRAAANLPRQLPLIDEQRPRRRRFRRLTVSLALIGAVAAAGLFAAANPFWQSAEAQQTSEEEVQAMKQMMRTQMAPIETMLEIWTEASTEALARPEIAENIAAYYDNLYKSLQKKSFTQEQAFQIVLENAPELGGSESALWMGMLGR